MQGAVSSTLGKFCPTPGSSTGASGIRQKKLPGWRGFARSKKFSRGLPGGGCTQLELTETLLPSQGLGQICTPHLPIILTKPASHHNSFRGSRCDSNQARTISLKPCFISWRFRLTSFDTQHISSHRFFSLLLMVRHNQFPGDFNAFRIQ